MDIEAIRVKINELRLEAAKFSQLYKAAHAEKRRFIYLYEKETGEKYKRPLCRAGSGMSIVNKILVEKGPMTVKQLMPLVGHLFTDKSNRKQLGSMLNGYCYKNNKHGFYKIGMGSKAKFGSHDKGET